jgi:hypothetical protein
MRYAPASLKGFGVTCTVLGFFTLTYGTKSVDRTSAVEASLRVGGIVLAVGLLLLLISACRNARLRYQERQRARHGFEVAIRTPKQGE